MTRPHLNLVSPVAGTYPVWYDPTYWYEGSVSHFDWPTTAPRHLSEALSRTTNSFMSGGLQYGLFVALVVLYLMGRRGRLLIRDLIEQWPVILPAIAGMGLYLLVNVQGRYVASFIVLLWLALFSAVRLNNTPESQRLLKSITLVLVVMHSFYHGSLVGPGSCAKC